MKTKILLVANSVQDRHPESYKKLKGEYIKKYTLFETRLVSVLFFADDQVIITNFEEDIEANPENNIIDRT